MGHGSYSVTNHVARATMDGYYTKNTHQIFKGKSINNAMNPHGIDVRESRDSNEHPNSLAIILGLDVTGSMGTVPHFLVKEGLPNIMDKIIKNGEKDPQILFLAVGDHECDDSPLQVGQFESNDELLDKWLTDVYLEGGGGGNNGESYLLAWYFAAYHTSIDCFEKRNRKGLLFTIGDEPVLKDLPSCFLKNIMGKDQVENFSSLQLLEKAQEKYDVYHIHIKQTFAGKIQKTIDEWKQLIGDNLIVVEKSTDISDVISNTVISKKVVLEDKNEKYDEIIL